MMNSRFRINLRFLQEAAEQAAGKEPIENQVQEFNTILRKQIDFLNHYCTIKYEELLLEIQNVARHIKRIVQLAASHDPTAGQELITDEELGVILLSSQKQLLAAGDDIVALELCIRQNFQLLIKAIIFFDTMLKTSASSWFMAQLSREWFANVNCDKLLIALSLCWEKWRILEGREWEKDVKAWKPPESFVRNTVKYWIRPDKVAQCKASIIRHCPYLIFGYSTDELEFLIDPYDVMGSRRGNIEDVSDAQMVSSVYFDSACGYSYAQRIKRMEAAQLIRFRWYGENVEVATREELDAGRRRAKVTYTADPQLEIFIERKTHHESWSGHESIKERFSLPQKRVSDYMSNRLDIEQWLAHVCAENKLSADCKKIKNIRSLAREILDCINEHELVPMLRTSYLRSAFQRSDRNDIRFSLDTNLCMVNEYKDPDYLKSSAAWCKTDNEILGNDEVIRFPYAVLEVKLQTEQPSWVSKMLYDCEAIMVFKFSKFQHGFAFLHRDKIPPGCPLPHWILDFEKKGFNTGFLIPSNKSGSLTSTKNSIMPPRPGTTNAMCEYKSIVYSRGRNVRKYDPKSILACERTLMHYCRKSLYTFGAGLVCFELGWLSIGIIALASSIACVIYSFHVYENRLGKIVNRMTKADYRERLDDIYAPVIAASLVSIGLLSSLTIQLARRL